MVMNVMSVRTLKKCFKSGVINAEVMRIMFSSLIHVQLTYWVGLVYIIVNSRPQLFSGTIDKYCVESSDLMAILGLARKCDYEIAKFK